MGSRGSGGGIAGYLTYNTAKNNAKPGEQFGKGEVKGIAAPESANNGASAASLIPMLTLGIPGSAVAATLMGAFQQDPKPSIFCGRLWILFIGKTNGSVRNILCKFHSFLNGVLVVQYRWSSIKMFQEEPHGGKKH